MKKTKRIELYLEVMRMKLRDEKIVMNWVWKSYGDEITIKVDYERED